MSTNTPDTDVVYTPDTDEVTGGEHRGMHDLQGWSKVEVSQPLPLSPDKLEGDAAPKRQFVVQKRVTTKRPN